MPDAGRQIREVRVPRDAELTPLKIEVSKRKTKRNGESKKKWWKMRDEWKDNKNDLSWNDPWLRSPWNTVWAYLSFLSEPRIQAYITYLKSPFWLNINTWTEEVFSLKDFCNQWGCCPFSLAKILDKSFTCLEWIFKCIIGQSKKWKMKKNENGKKKWL